MKQLSERRAKYWHRSFFNLHKTGDKKDAILFTIPTTIAFVALIVIILACALAPVIAPYSPTQQILSDSLELPSADHLLGADKVGRDVFTRVLYGGRTTLLSALGVVIFSIVFGVPLGLISGYYGGKVDAIIGRVCDVILSFPSLLLAFVFVAGFGRNLFNSVIALGIVYLPMLIRLIRSLTLVEKNKIYVEAAVSIGYSDARIMFLHILPNCISTATVQLTLDLAYAILDLAAMSFLGLGVQPPTADWGQMLDEGREYILMNPYLALAPGVVIIITVVAINIFSDGLHQYFEPTQRRLSSFEKVEKKEAKLAAAAQTAE
ncbi:MAG: ABC transporter permease [Clostridia bacterium]|nr:ABC transporter permease [Clostridia bacterium]